MRLEIFSRVDFKTGKRMDMEKRDLKMGTFTEANSREGNLKGQEYTGGRMAQSTEGVLKKDCCTEEESGDQKRTTSMKGSIETTKSMEKALTNGAMVWFSMVSSKRMCKSRKKQS
jgi:hypothetical protein